MALGFHHLVDLRASVLSGVRRREVVISASTRPTERRSGSTRTDLFVLLGLARVVSNTTVFGVDVLVRGSPDDEKAVLPPLKSGKFFVAGGTSGRAKLGE